LKFVLLLLFVTPPHPTAAQYVKMLNAEQQIINDLTAQNRALATELEKLKYELYGPPGSKVYPRFEHEKPVCPVDGFVVQYEVKDNSFVAYCVRQKEQQ
jgi:hypothetical protein